MRTVALVPLLVCLCLLTGCSGGVGGPGDGGSTVTPADLPPEDLERVPYPPGVYPNGTVDANRVTRAHRTALSNQSYTFSLETTNVWAVGDNRTLRRTVDRTAQVAPGDRLRDRYTVVTVDRGERRSRTVDQYTAGPSRFLRVDDEAGTVEYRRFSVSEVGLTRGIEEEIQLYLRLRNATIERRFVDGDPAFVVRATGVDNPIGPPTGNVTVRAVIRPDGQVAALTVRLQEVTNERPRSRVIRAEITDIGATTVPEPEWLEEARNETA